MRTDTVISGGLAGIIGNVPKTMITWAFYFLGYTKYTFEDIAAGYFVSQNFVGVNHPVALITGFIGDYTLAGLSGVLIFLLLRFTGTDYAELKGIGFGSVEYILFFGVAMSINITRVSLVTPLPNLLLFFPNVIFGFTTAWIIKKYMLRKTVTKFENFRSKKVLKLRFTPDPAKKVKGPKQKVVYKRPIKLSRLKRLIKMKDEN